MFNKGYKMTEDHRKKLSIARRKHPSGRRIEYGESSFNHLYACYKKRALRSKRIFDLSKDEFRILIKQNCFYCGSEPVGIYYANKDTAYGEVKFNGLDRKNNDLGYINSNVVTCCKICNYAKHIQNHDDFINWIKKVFKNLEVK